MRSLSLQNIGPIRTTHEEGYASLLRMLPPRVRAPPHLRLRGASVRKLIDAGFRP